MTVVRKSYAGASAATTLPSGCLIADTTLNVASIVGFPNTTVGPFVITIDRGFPSEEKVLIASYAGTALTVAAGGRGYDGTSAIAHSANATVAHTLDAQTVQEAHDVAALLGTVAPSTQAMGDAGTPGTSTVAAAADHKHTMPSFATGAVVASNPGDTEADGTSASPARVDHRHAREASALGNALELPGATSPTRYVGATASGSPTTGTFAQGDFVVDLSGTIWICTAAGTPGAWNCPGVKEPVVAGSYGDPSWGSYSAGPLIFQFGHAQGTANAAGVLSVTFPQAFPNGALGVIPLTVANTGGVQQYAFSVITTSLRTTGFNGQFFQLGAFQSFGANGQVVASANASISQNYLAIGF